MGEGEGEEEEGCDNARSGIACLLSGAFADGACDKRVTIAGSASLLFGGTLPPSTAPNDLRPPPPVAVRAASVGADGFALAAAAAAAAASTGGGGGGGLWQCRYDRPGAAWSAVDGAVEGLPARETFSGVAVGDCRCLALAEDGSVFSWRRRRRRRRRRNGSGDDEDKDDDDTEEEEDEDEDEGNAADDVPGRARCVLGPRLEPSSKQQQQLREGGGGGGGGPSTPDPLLRLPVGAVAAGRRHFLAVARPPHAAAFAWGCSARGQCAVAPGAAGGGGGGGGKSGSWVPRPRAIARLGGVPLSLCAAGDAHSLVASADGASVFAFGDLGASDGAFACEPTLVSEEDLPLGDEAGAGAAAAAAVVALAAGGRHSVALDSAGRAHAWGDGSWGQLLRGGTTEGSGRFVVVGVVAGWRHTVLVLGKKEDGSA